MGMASLDIGRHAKKLKAKSKSKSRMSMSMSIHMVQQEQYSPLGSLARSDSWYESFEAIDEQ